MDFGNLIEGALLAAVGAFMVFAPASADRLNAESPFIRTGGALRRPFGWGALVFGILIVAIWCGTNL
jgi:hypothetical protein